MHVGILLCGEPPQEVIETFGDWGTIFTELLAPFGISTTVFEGRDGQMPAREDAEGWLLTGSACGVYEPHAFIPPLEDFIRSAHAVKTPMVGICFGHQIIAQALGGRVIKYPGGWAVGRRLYQMEGLGEVALNAWHQDQVVDLPPGARVIATNSFTRNAGLAYGAHILTLQPHPEITPEMVQAYIPLKRGTADYEDAMMDRAMADTALATDADRVAAHLARHLKTTALQSA